MTNSYEIQQRPKGESKIEAGIKLKNKHKVRIAGAVLRLEMVPRGAGYGCDYRFTIVLPNDKQIEVEDVHSTVCYGDFMAALYEAATGQKPIGGENKKLYVVGGIPVDIREVVEDLSDEITESIDPLEERLVTLPKTPETTTPKVPETALPSLTHTTTRVDSNLDINSEVRKQKGEVARRNREAEMGRGIM